MTSGGNLADNVGTGEGGRGGAGAGEHSILPFQGLLREAKALSLYGHRRRQQPCEPPTTPAISPLRLDHDACSM